MNLKNIIILLLLLPIISGCINIEEPVTESLKTSNEPFNSSFPEIELVKNVTLQEVEVESGLYIPKKKTETPESKFGKAGEVANPYCVVSAMQNINKELELIETEFFWNEIAEGRNELTLEEIYNPPILERMKNQDVDIIVAAYHEHVHAVTYFMEAIVEGGYSDQDVEVGSVAVVDFKNKTLLSAMEATFTDVDIIAHIFVVVPLALLTFAKSEPCQMIGEAAGSAIASTNNKERPRVVVVAAKNNPYQTLRKRK